MIFFCFGFWKINNIPGKNRLLQKSVFVTDFGTNTINVKFYFENISRVGVLCIFVTFFHTHSVLLCGCITHSSAHSAHFSLQITVILAQFFTSVLAQNTTFLMVFWLILVQIDWNSFKSTCSNPRIILKSSYFKTNRKELERFQN